MIRKNKGFGIIELMVSILIASIVIAGMYKLLTSSALNFGISSASSRSGKTYRQVDNMLNNLLFQTGFINYRRVAKNEEFGALDSNFDGKYADFNDSWQESEYVRGFEDGDNDAIRIRFWGASVNDDTSTEVGGANANGFIFDCRGVPVPNTVMMEMLLRVDAGNGLVCSQNVLSSTIDASDFNGIEQVIDRSIVALRFIYGSTYKTYTSGALNQMYFADEIDGAGDRPDWSDINVVKYAMVTSQNTGQRAIAGNPPLNLFSANEAPGGVAVQYVVPDNDRYNMHRVVSGSISFVNANNFE